MNSHIFILPIVRKENIRDLIYKFDNNFPTSIIARSDFPRILENIENKAFVVGAVMDNQLVGFSAFYINDYDKKCVYISLIAVEKEYRCQGVGSKIMEYIKEMTLFNGFNLIRLEVENTDVEAIDFYVQQGFSFESVASETSQYMQLKLL